MILTRLFYRATLSIERALDSSPAASAYRGLTNDITHVALEAFFIHAVSPGAAWEHDVIGHLITCFWVFKISADDVVSQDDRITGRGTDHKLERIGTRPAVCCFRLRVVDSINGVCLNCKLSLAIWLIVFNVVDVYHHAAIHDAHGSPGRVARIDDTNLIVHAILEKLGPTAGSTHSVYIVLGVAFFLSRTWCVLCHACRKEDS